MILMLMENIYFHNSQPLLHRLLAKHNIRVLHQVSLAKTDHSRIEGTTYKMISLILHHPTLSLETCSYRPPKASYCSLYYTLYCWSITLTIQNICLQTSKTSQPVYILFVNHNYH